MLVLLEPFHLVLRHTARLARLILTQVLLPHLHAWIVWPDTFRLQGPVPAQVILLAALRHNQVAIHPVNLRHSQLHRLDSQLKCLQILQASPPANHRRQVHSQLVDPLTSQLFSLRANPLTRQPSQH